MATLFVEITERAATILEAATEAEVAAVRQALHGRDIAALADAPLLRDPTLQAIIDLLANATASAYIGRPTIFPLISVRIEPTMAPV